MCKTVYPARSLLHPVRNLLCLSSWCHFWKPHILNHNAVTAPVTPYCYLCTQHKQMQPHICFFLKIHIFPGSPSHSFKISPFKPSPTALLPLFVKSEIMREEHVSSYYTALCLSKNTQAAPWQLTTHSQLSNAAEPPKRPLFNVTRWHCVMQAKHCDMICPDSLLKWKYCTCGGHCCPENGGRICCESDMVSSPILMSLRVWSPNAVGGVLYSYLDLHMPYKITNYPDRLIKCTVTAIEALLICINGSWRGDAKLPCWIII